MAPTAPAAPAAASSASSQEIVPEDRNELAYKSRKRSRAGIVCKWAVGIGSGCMQMSRAPLVTLESRVLHVTMTLEDRVWLALVADRLLAALLESITTEHRRDSHRRPDKRIPTGDVTQPHSGDAISRPFPSFHQPQRLDWNSQTHQSAAGHFFNQVLVSDCSLSAGAVAHLHKFEKPPPSILRIRVTHGITRQFRESPLIKASIFKQKQTETNRRKIVPYLRQLKL